MLFNSIEFFLFFPLVTALYFLLPHQWRWLMLLIASCVFYMFFVPAYIFILLATIVVDYVAAIQIEKSSKPNGRRWLIGSIISTCLILAVFKYFNFFIDNFNGIANLIGWNYSLNTLSILLPIGLSFHTFQSLSYVVEVYRGNQKAERHFGIYSLYVMFYPQLVAGPIERPQNVLHQFREKHSLTYANVSAGMQRIVWGLFKKVVIADNLAQFVSPVYEHAGAVSWMYLSIAVVFFSFQIYCDFSGYSDIAIGAARVMGFRLMENFKLPYRSAGVGMFWSKWHISLSTWFRDYVYIPLGGNRKGAARTSLNLFIVFAISGFWHGANWTFVVWGMAHGLWLVLENRMNVRWEGKLRMFLGTLLTFVGVSFLWIFFRATSFEQAIQVIKGIATFQSQPGFLPSVFVPLNGAVIIGKILMLVVFVLIDRKVTEIVLGTRAIGSNRKVWLFAALLACLALFGQWGKVDFIYFQF
ncbi:MAG: MBOAT family protein [Flavobacteriales bacterium]|nr:MBOAT family protein [Flavobacteriales bacterium]